MEELRRHSDRDNLDSIPVILEKLTNIENRLIDIKDYPVIKNNVSLLMKVFWGEVMLIGGLIITAIIKTTFKI